MAFCKTPIRILSRRNFDKGDVESVYAEIVKVIGGTYYSGGVAQGPNNGTIDTRNFAPETGIPLSNRSSTYAVFPIELPEFPLTTAAGTYTKFIAPPRVNTVQEFTPIVIGLTLVNFAASLATNSGSCQFFYVRNGASTQIGATVNWTNISTGQNLLTNQTGLSVSLQRGDLLKYTVTFTGATFGNMGGQIWCKSLIIKG